MKIALVILHADAARGGAERYTLDLAASLVERGHAVFILASSFQTQPTAGRQVLLNSTGRTRTGRYLRFLDSLDSELDRNDYDVVHAMLPVRRCDVYHPHAGVAADAIAAGHLVKSGRIRQAVAKFGNRINARRQQYAAIERKMLGVAHPPVVLCLSHLIQAVVQNCYPLLPANRLVPLFNGVDIARFDPANRPESRQQTRRQFGVATDAVVGLILAQDFERKGVGFAVRALAQVADPRLMLLVGGKPEPGPYKRLARSLGVQNQVVFVGPVSDVFAFYQAADFFVLPTRFDPCSLVVLEALAMGLPVITTRQNGASEIMKNGEHGNILDSPNSLPILTDAMSGMLNALMRMDMRSACISLRPQLSSTRNINDLVSVYHNIYAMKAA